MLPAELHSEIDALKKSIKVELNIKVDKICKKLLENQIAYYQVCTPDQFLIHPSNRGGLMLNHFDVHDKGKTMLKIGVQLSKLVDSVAFELSSDPAKRAKQLDKNKQIVAVSKACLLQSVEQRGS